jgi:hypothetical protein
MSDLKAYFVVEDFSHVATLADLDNFRLGWISAIPKPKPGLGTEHPSGVGGGELEGK